MHGHGSGAHSNGTLTNGSHANGSLTNGTHANGTHGGDGNGLVAGKISDNVHAPTNPR